MWIRVRLRTCIRGEKKACAVVLPFPLPLHPVAAFVFLDFAFPFAFFFPFAFAFAEEVFIEIRRRTPLRTDAFLSACGGADDPNIAAAISRCSATSAVAIIAMLRLRHFFGGTIGEEGSRSSILLNIRGSPSSSSSMSSVGWSDRSTVSGTSLPGRNASVEDPGNDGKPRRVPVGAACSATVCVVSFLSKCRPLLGSALYATRDNAQWSCPPLPLAVLGTCGQEHVPVVACGSIFTGEASIFTGEASIFMGVAGAVRLLFGVRLCGLAPQVGVPAGRLRFFDGVPLSEKDSDLQSCSMSSAMEARVAGWAGGSVSFASTKVNSFKTESTATISAADASPEACVLIENGY